jgi:hypothetical protein
MAPFLKELANLLIIDKAAMNRSADGGGEIRAQGSRNLGNSLVGD